MTTTRSSNETGAPILRNKLFLPVDGNHDLGSTGVSANLLADNSASAFSGNLTGGDALSHFNDFYFPQSGPEGFDIQYAWNGNSYASTGFNLRSGGRRKFAGRKHPGNGCAARRGEIESNATVTSTTALPVNTNRVETHVR